MREKGHGFSILSIIGYICGLQPKNKHEEEEFQELAKVVDCPCRRIEGETKDEEEVTN